MIFTSANGASVKRRVVMNALIIGLGNDYRSDDAVGRVVARKLGAESLDGVRILGGKRRRRGIDARLAGC